MTDARTPGDPARTGPWTVRICITASCTRCGAVPLDEDSGLTPHFDSTAQAREELPRDWCWHLTARTGFGDDDRLLCPTCAAADESGQPAPGSDSDLAGAGSGWRPGAVPYWLEAGRDPDRELPANARAFPAAHQPQQEEG